MKIPLVLSAENVPICVRKSALAFSFLRTTAVFTIISFILTQTWVSVPSGHAIPPESGDSISVPVIPNAGISIPSNLGIINESYVPRDLHLSSKNAVQRITDSAKSQFPGPDIRKLVIFIQDAHDSLEAQENIAKIISHLVSLNGIKTVLEEGYEGPVPSDEYFGFIEDPKIKEKVSYFLLDHLRIGGAEYAHINREKDFTLLGADSFNLHTENIDQ